MRIAIISPFQLRFRRGIERSAVNLAIALSQQTESVDILCWAGPIKPEQYTRKGNIDFKIMPIRRYFQALWAVPFYLQYFVRNKPDVVIIFFAGYGEALALALTRYLYQPIVVFSAGYPFELVPHRFEEFKSWKLHNFLDAVVVKAPHMAPAIEGFFRQSVMYIPNGVDTEYFYPACRLNSTTGDIHLTTIAAIERRKGFESVLLALPGVIDQFKDVHYTIVGDGRDREWLKALIKEVNLSAYVTLAGEVDDVRPFLRTTDLFLLPSSGEGMPNAYLEALAMGLPTLVSTDPPYDTIADSAFSRQIDCSNPDMMQEGILSLLRDPLRRQSMGQAARREAETKYNWSVVALQYLSLFESLLENRQKSGSESVKC